jgi:hypothetical protein
MIFTILIGVTNSCNFFLWWTAGQIRRSRTVSRGRRLDANLDRRHSEEIGCFKLERKAKNKQVEGLGKQEKKTLKREKDIKIHRRSLSMC